MLTRSWAVTDLGGLAAEHVIAAVADEQTHLLLPVGPRRAVLCELDAHCTIAATMTLPSSHVWGDRAGSEADEAVVDGVPVLPVAVSVDRGCVVLSASPLPDARTSSFLDGAPAEDVLLWSWERGTVEAMFTGEALAGELWAAAFEPADATLWLVSAVSRDDVSTLSLHRHGQAGSLDLVSARHGADFERDGWGFVRLTPCGGAVVVSIGTCGAATEHLHVIVEARGEALVEQARRTGAGTRLLGRGPVETLRLHTPAGIVAFSGAAAAIELPAWPSRIEAHGGSLMALGREHAAVHTPDGWRPVDIAALTELLAAWDETRDEEVLAPWDDPRVVRTADGDALLVTGVTENGLVAAMFGVTE
ncbi:hypothetical protein OV203_41415 [Nannocystis sp. ILAH1]|uniref:hypothetical protein n=1 Tax=Nannocystis sp. ILAH1 TaxID=2996789 RepID=UPI00226ED61D|nr:hypothetical protein [Nannocystis sp. ILAH1]MCY0993670.1 hypothetical protein [Nannocystis sp. ILAH1]